MTYPLSQRCDPDRPSSWVKYRRGLCEGCWAGCCTMPVEVRFEDLVRLGVADPDEAEGSHKKLAKRLISEGVVRSYRAGTDLFMLGQQQNGDCVFLGKDRLCTVYEKRPEVCRRFPETMGTRVGFCPAGPKATSK